MLRRLGTTTLALTLVLFGCTASEETSTEAGSERSVGQATAALEGGGGAACSAATPHHCTMRMIDGGGSHTVALDSAGHVWTWGRNAEGQLGDGTTTRRTTPVAVSTPSGMSTVVAIAAGDYHTVALDAAGHAWTWGWNDYGQLGDGTTTRRNTPVAVSMPSGMGTIVAIAAGYLHTVALDSAGNVWAWGNNDYGQLGDGTTSQRNTPVAVSAPSGMGTVVAIAAGGYHTVALDAAGHVWTWGYNVLGQLGDGTTTNRTTPVAVSMPSGMGTVVAIAAGDYHTVALDSAGHVWTWGRNDDGQLGDGTTTQRNAPVAVSAPSGMGTVVAIAAGDAHTVALDSAGHVWTWGYNFYGQLGDGTTTQRTTPVAVSMPSGMGTVVAVAADGAHTVALDSAGRVWTWGYNGYGQLGDGTTTQRNTPVEVHDLNLIDVCHTTLPSCDLGASPPACTITNATDGTSCGSGRYCFSGSCEAGCFIDGSVYAANAPNPANSCQLCDPSTSTSAWANVADTTTCNDGNACTHHDVCTSGRCGGTAYTCTASECQASSTCDGTGSCTIVNASSSTSCTDDHDPCTADFCDGSGTCGHTTRADGSSCGSGLVCHGGSCASGCLIGSTYYASGTINPDNACQACTPASSTSAWSNRSNGTTCNDGNACTRNDVCTSGTCGGTAYTCSPTACQTSSTCDGSGGCNVVNAPSTRSCTDDGNTCTADFCDGSGGCGHTALADGTLCGASGVCRSSTCVEGCFIDGAIVTEGTLHPTNPCLACRTSLSRTAWSPVDDGTGCNDGNACTHHDVCRAGTCGGTAYTCTASECEASSTCDGAGGCTRTPSPSTRSCGDDGNPCTADYCNGSGSCGHTSLADGTACGAGRVCVSAACEAGCFIGGTLYPDGAPNPANACEVCETSASTSAWSPTARGSTCDDGNICTTEACDGAGRCAMTPVADGTSCASGEVCSSGVCGEGCFIGGHRYDEGDLNPANACERCTPSAATLAWSPMAAASACDDGNACTTEACDGAGRCATTPVADGTACGTGSFCDEGVCSDRCLIEGVLYESGDANPENACEACDPAAANDAWSPTDEGSACDDENECTEDACDGAGACVSTSAPDGTACGEAGHVCAAGVCTTPMPDAGVGEDAGIGEDAGGRIDAGSAADAGGRIDAGSVADAGAGFDGGGDAPASERSDCSCSAAGTSRDGLPSGLGLFVLFGLGLVLRRRRSTSLMR